MPACAATKKAHSAVIDGRSWKVPRKPSDPAVPLLHMERPNPEREWDLDFLRNPQKVGAAWWKEHIPFTRHCAFPEF